MYSLSTLKIMKYHHGNLKEELISSACAICEATGHDHMSLRSIAKEANVSQTAPYRHFKTKESLLAEVSKRGFDELTKRMSEALNKKNNSLSLEDQFLEMGLAYLEFGVEKRNIYDLMHSPSIQKADFPELLESAGGAFDVLVKILMKLHPGIDENQLSQKCMKHWAMMHGLIGILDLKTVNASDSDAAKAMINTKKDLRAFLKETVDF
jgi:AcrR family transcriptional regulator